MEIYLYVVIVRKDVVFFFDTIKVGMQRKQSFNLRREL
jgi:hypothetical protein